MGLVSFSRRYSSIEKYLQKQKNTFKNTKRLPKTQKYLQK